MSCVSAWQALKFTHDVVALLLLAATITLMALTLGAPADKMALHLTSTFLSAYHTDDPAASWAPPLDPLTPAQVADTYYTCLHRATVGFALPVGCARDDPGDYRRCIDAKTSSPEYRARIVTDGVAELLRDVQGDTVAMSLAAYNAIMQVLQAPPQFLASSLALIDPGSEHAAGIRALIDRTADFRGVAGCLSRVDQDPQASRAVASLFQDLWECAAEAVTTDDRQAAAFQQCVPLSSWPTLDVMQSPYSTALLGSYNRPFVLLVAMWLLSSFAVYTAWLGVETPPNTRGKPMGLFARCGLFLTVFCVVWNGLGCGMMVLIKAFAPPADAGGFPMTVQTVFVAGVAALLGAGYFLRELWEQSCPDPVHKESSKQVYEKVPNAIVVDPQADSVNSGVVARARFQGYAAHSAGLAGFVRSPGGIVVGDLTDAQYTPLLAPAWSDGWLLCDGLFLIGIIGTSNDVVTGELVRSVLLVLYAAAARTAYVRLFYESYVNEVPSTTTSQAIYDANKSRSGRGWKDSDQNLVGLRIMTLLANMAVLCFALPSWVLVLGRYSASALIVSYVSFTSIVPVIACFVYNICVDLDRLSADLASVSQVGFIYGALVRAIFVFVVASTATADADANTRLARALALLG